MRASNQGASVTVTFHREETHRALRATAERLGISMNELAEAAIEHELTLFGPGLQERLERTATRVRDYRGEGVDADVEDFAKGEMEVEDPLRSERAGSRVEDPLGVGALFADPPEQ